MEPIKFLREREIVHFQRFGEALRIVQDYFDSEHTFIMPKTSQPKSNCKCGKNPSVIMPRER